MNLSSNEHQHSDACSIGTATGDAGERRVSSDLNAFMHLRLTSAGPIFRGNCSFFRGYVFDEQKRDGVFASWRWDGTCLRVVCDRYGMFPLFYATAPGQIWVSPSLFTLLKEGAPTELDEPALYIFLQSGNPIADRTFFKSIRTVPRNGLLRWTSGNLAASDEIIISEPSSLSRSAALDGYGTLFAESVRTCLSRDSEVVVTLSGGRDSRHILFAMLEARTPPKRCYTVKGQSKDESSVAEQVAARAKVAHVRCERAPRSITAERAMLQMCQLQSFEHAWLLPLLDSIDTDGVLFDGLGGDVLSAGLFLTEEKLSSFRAGRFDELAAQYCSSGTSLLKKHLRTTQVHDDAASLIASEMAKHARAPNPVGSFMFWNRTRRNVAMSPFGIFARQRCVYAPYIKADVWDFLTALPAEYMVDHAFHTDTISTHYSRYSDLPYYRHASATPSRYSTNRRLALELLGALTKRRRRLLETKWLVPRLIRSTFDPSYKFIDWWFPVVVHTMEVGEWL